MNGIRFQLCVLLVVAGLSGFCGDNPHSGVRFRLDFRSSEIGITSRSVGNAVNYSGSPQVNASLSGGDVESNRVQHRVMKASPVMYPWQTNSIDVLHFPQRTIVEDGEIKVMPVAINFNDSAVDSAVQTAYVRFRWDGCINTNKTVTQWLMFNGYGWTGNYGWGIGLNYHNAAKPNEAQPAVMVPQKTVTSWDASLTVLTNVWYDLFVVFSPDPDNVAKTSVRISLVKAPSRISSQYSNTSMPAMKSDRKTVDQVMSFSSSLKEVKFGAESSSSSYLSSTYNYGLYSKCFRGDVARAMIWDRALSDNEMWQVSSGASGSDWKLGVDNGRADEFAGEDASGVWLVTNGWFSISRELTESKPIWTIKCPVLDRESLKDKILEIRPILDGGLSYIVEVAVNGVSAGEYDLAYERERAIPIKGRLWTSGSDGLATITVTRKEPFAGSLGLDSMALCGGWRMGGSTMSTEGFTRAFYNIGQTDPRTMQKSTNVLPGDGANGVPNSPYVSIAAYVPRAALSTHDYTFSVKVNGRTGLQYALPHALLINGHEVFQVADVAPSQILSCKIPNNLLSAGMNVFTLTNKASAVVGKALWANYEYYDISVEGHMHGLSVVIR